MPTDQYGSAIFFFVVSAVYVWMCALAYKFVLEKSAYFKYYQRRASLLKTVQVASLGDFFRAIKTQFSLTRGLLYALTAVFAMSFMLFPGVMDATSLKSINDKSWF